MIKRIISLLILITMFVSVTPLVMADNFSVNTQNLYYKWGDFETSAQAEQARTSGETKTTKIAHIDGGAEGSAKAIEVQMASADSAELLNFHFPGVVNERYTVSFWLKTAETSAESVTVIFKRYEFSKKNEITLPLTAADGNWHKYEFAWLCDDADTKNTLKRSGIWLYIRF